MQEIKLVETPNLFLRGGVLYFRVRAGGILCRKRSPYQGVSALTTQGNPRPAVLKALSDWMGYERERADLRARNPEAVAEGRVPTWEKLEEVYLEIAADHLARTGKPKKYVAKNNANMLRVMLKGMGVVRTESMALATLARFDRWCTERVKDDDEEEAASKRYIASRILSQASSCWAKWTRVYYLRRGLVIPRNVDQWPRIEGYAPIYVLPPKELREATEKGGQALEENDPGVWLAFAMMRHHGMRPGDATRAEWTWFQQKGEGRYSLRFQPSKTKRSAKGRYVDQTISADHWERLRAAWDRAGDGGNHVIPGGEDKRQQAILEVNRLMRTTWKPEEGKAWETEKVSYELRKLFVSEIFNRYGLVAASAYSGDNPTTIQYYYAAADPELGPVLDMPKLEPVVGPVVLKMSAG